MFGLGGQHVLAMFGSTAIVPVLIGFPVSTTLLFSGIGTLLFVLITRNRVPSYTGSSFAFIAPVIAAKADGGMPAALGGILVRGRRARADRPDHRPRRLPRDRVPAAAGRDRRDRRADRPQPRAGGQGPVLPAGGHRALHARRDPARHRRPARPLRRSSRVFLGVAAGYVFAAILGKVDWTAVHEADWVGFPDFTTPTFDGHAILLIVPAVVLVLIAENAAHVKAVAAMTERDLDPLIGRSIMADGAATTLAGAFGGSGTTTYAENIGVMGLTRVYSTLAYIIAGADRDRARAAAEVRRGHQRDPGRRPRRRGDRPVRPDRRARRAHLDRGAGRLPRPGQPHHRRASR